MNNLYNKIYKAINEGLIKSLHIDDNSDEVTYSHHKVNNNANNMPYLVKQFLNNTQEKSAIYQQIIDYHNDSGYLYKPKNLSELKQIYDNIPSHLIFSNIDISWIDFADIIDLVLDNDTEIPVQDFVFNKHNPVFLKITNDFGYSIYLHKDLLQITPKKTKRQKIDNDYTWINPDLHVYRFNNAVNKMTKDEALNDYNGYENTYFNKNIYNPKSRNKKNDFSNYPIFQYVEKLAKKKKINNYQAYIPALGELYTIARNVILIKNILYIINNGNITDDMQTLNRNTNYFLGTEDYLGDINWTSTEYDKDTFWAMNGNNIKPFKKIHSGHNLIPLFHKI